jgi:hypothetical protein
MLDLFSRKIQDLKKKSKFSDSEKVPNRASQKELLAKFEPSSFFINISKMFFFYS